jgi:hypothetical protein
VAERTHLVCALRPGLVDKVAVSITEAPGAGSAVAAG